MRIIASLFLMCCCCLSPALADQSQPVSAVASGPAAASTASPSHMSMPPTGVSFGSSMGGRQCVDPQSVSLEVFPVANPADMLPPFLDPFNFTATPIGQVMEQIRAAILPISPCFAIFSPQRSPNIYVIGTAADRAMVHRILDSVEQGSRLVVIQTRVYEVDANAEQSLGIQFQSPILSATLLGSRPGTSNGNSNGGNPSGGLGPLLPSPVTLQATLNALATDGQARLLADPNVTTISGRVVQIHAGSDLNVLAYSPDSAANAGGNQLLPTIQTFTLGVTVEMVPIVNAAGDGVALSIKAQESHLLGTQNGAPEIARRDEETSVFLHDDQMVVLGGLRIDSSNHDNEKVPGLGDLPLIGGIFRYKSTQTQHSELVMLLRAKVISIDGGSCDQTMPYSSQPIDCAQNLNQKLPKP